MSFKQLLTRKLEIRISNTDLLYILIGFFSFGVSYHNLFDQKWILFGFNIIIAIIFIAIGCKRMTVEVQNDIEMR